MLFRSIEALEHGVADVLEQPLVDQHPAGGGGPQADVPAAVHGVRRLGGDGDSIYVVNTNTDDVTIFSAEDLSVIDKIPTGSQTMVIIPSPNARHRYVIASKRLTILDVEEHAVIRQYAFDSPAVRFDESAGVAYVLTRKTLEVLDIETDRKRTRLNSSHSSVSRMPSSA